MKLTIFCSLIGYLSSTLCCSSVMTLHQAAKEGNIDQCKALLKEGTDVNPKDENNSTPLHWASQEGYLLICILLIEYRADIHAKNKWGFTPLRYAARAGHYGICLLLVERGADVNAKDHEKHTPLHCASWEGYQDICTLLIEHQTQLNRQLKKNFFSDYDPSPMCIYGPSRVNIVDLTIAKNKRGDTPLHCASKMGHKSICDLLIKKGAEINGKNKKGDTPLHYASRMDHPTTCSLLIENGANIDERNNLNGWFSDGGYTPLHIASIAGNQNTCELLLLYGADFKVKTYQKRTVLDLANNKIESWILALDHDIKNGETALHRSAAKGNQEACVFLIKKGFSIYQRSNEGKTALDVAKNDEVKKVILMHEKLKVTGYITRLYDRNAPDVIISMIVGFTVRGLIT